MRGPDGVAAKGAETPEVEEGEVETAPAPAPPTDEQVEEERGGGPA